MAAGTCVAAGRCQVGGWGMPAGPAEQHDIEPPPAAAPVMLKRSTALPGALAPPQPPDTGARRTRCKHSSASGATQPSPTRTTATIRPTWQVSAQRVREPDIPQLQVTALGSHHGRVTRLVCSNSGRVWARVRGYGRGGCRAGQPAPPLWTAAMAQNHASDARRAADAPKLHRNNTKRPQSCSSRPTVPTVHTLAICALSAPSS
jgi:hypothetical protein